MSGQVANPIINGNEYQHSSAQIHLGMRQFEGFKAVSFKQELKPGVARGTSPRKRGRTKGVHNADGSFEMYLADYQELIDALGDGYMERTFRMLINYQEPGLPLMTVELIDCRITSEDQSSSEGDEALVMKCELDIMRIRINGKEAVTARRR